MKTDGGQLRGNRLALVGAVVYLLEWAVIVPTGTPDPVDQLGTSPGRLVELYADKATGIALLAGWLGLVLLGRIVFAGGLRAALSPSSRALPLMDVAFGAMVVSVALEIAGQGAAGAAATLAESGSDATAIVVLNALSGWLTQLLFIPLGAFVATASLAMLKSRLFPWWMTWLGLLSGLALALGGVIAAARIGAPASSEVPIGQGLVALGIPAFWCRCSQLVSSCSEGRGERMLK